MSHIPASAMPHAAPKHHDDGAEARASTIGSPAIASGEVPAVLSPSPVFESAPAPVPDTKTPTPSAAAKPVSGRRVGIALAAGAVALIAGFVAVGVPSLRSSNQLKRED